MLSAVEEIVEVHRIQGTRRYGLSTFKELAFKQLPPPTTATTSAATTTTATTCGYITTTTTTTTITTTTTNYNLPIGRKKISTISTTSTTATNVEPSFITSFRSARISRGFGIEVPHHLLHYRVVSGFVDRQALAHRRNMAFPQEIWRALDEV